MKIQDSAGYQLTVTAAWHDWDQCQVLIQRTVDQQPMTSLELYLTHEQVEKIIEVLTRTIAR